MKHLTDFRKTLETGVDPRQTQQETEWMIWGIAS